MCARFDIFYGSHKFYSKVAVCRNEKLGSAGLEEELTGNGVGGGGIVCVRTGSTSTGSATGDVTAAAASVADQLSGPMTDQRLLGWETRADGIQAVVVGGAYDFTFAQVCYAAACLQDVPDR